MRYNFPLYIPFSRTLVANLECRLPGREPKTKQIMPRNNTSITISLGPENYGEMYDSSKLTKKKNMEIQDQSMKNSKLQLVPFIVTYRHHLDDQSRMGPHGLTKD